MTHLQRAPRRRLRGVIGATLATTVLVTGLATAGPAIGLGYSSRPCYSNGVAYGGSDATSANTSITAGVIDCGSARVREKYRTSGGSLLWTGWVQTGYSATTHPPAGTTGVNGQHDVSSPGPGPLYAGNFPFTT